MAMMGSAEAGCWPRNLARAFLLVDRLAHGRNPAAASARRWELLGPQCRQAALRCAVDTAGRRSRRPASRSSRPRPEPSRSGPERPLRSPGTPRHRSGVQRCCDPAAGRPATRRSAPSPPGSPSCGVRLGAARRPVLCTGRSSPRPDGRRRRDGACCPCERHETSGVDLTVPTTSIRCASASSVLGAFGGRTLMTSMPSMPTSISARTTPPTSTPPGTSDASTTPFGWRAPAALQVKFPSGARLVSSISIRRDMRRSRYRARAAPVPQPGPRAAWEHQGGANQRRWTPRCIERIAFSYD